MAVITGTVAVFILLEPGIFLNYPIVNGKSICYNNHVI